MDRDIFISYVEEDGAVARGLAAELRSLGHRTWAYEEDGVPGHSYLEQVHAAISKCDAFVLLASPESLRSHQVRREAETAYEQQKLVIPVRLKVSHTELQGEPIFRMVSGTAVSVATDGTDPLKVAQRIDASLRKKGFGADANPAQLPTIANDRSLHKPRVPAEAQNKPKKEWGRVAALWSRLNARPVSLTQGLGMVGMASVVGLVAASVQQISKSGWSPDVVVILLLATFIALSVWLSRK